MVLKLAASLRTSLGPAPSGERVSSAPSPSRWAAASSRLRGRLTQRASAVAIKAAASRPASDTAPSESQRTAIRWASGAVGRESATTPTVEPLSSSTTGARTSSRSSTP